MHNDIARPCSCSFLIRADRGAWEGTVTEDRTQNVYTMTLTVVASAAQGAVAGQIRYNITEVGFPLDCVGGLVANVPPEGDEYRFQEAIGGQCTPNGEVRLIHNRTDGTLGYAGYSTAGVHGSSATLRRRP